MLRSRAKLAACLLASAAFVILPAWTHAVSAKPKLNVIHCKAHSTKAHPCKGTKHADKIIGTNGPDVIEGLGGNDVINGQRGDDTIDGGSGDDTINGGPGNDEIDGSTGDDHLSGGPGDDIENGGTGDDQVDCGQGDDGEVVDSTGDDTNPSSNCEQDDQEFSGTVTAISDTSITIDDGSGTPIDANITPDTEYDHGIAVGDTVKMEAVPATSGGPAPLDAVHIEKTNESDDEGD